MSASAKVVDFSNVKDGGQFNRNRIPAGDYLAKIVAVADEKSKKDQAFQYLFTIQIVKRASSKFPYYCKLADNQLWKLRNLLIAGGISVPKSKIKVDVNRLVGKTIGVTVEDTEFDDKEQSEITAVFPAAELQDAPVDDDDDDDTDDDDDDADDSIDDDIADDDQTDAEEAADDDEEAVEDDEDEADEEEAGDEGDEWDAITDRLELRKALKKVAPDVKTSTSMSEDDIRDLIRGAIAKAEAAKAKPAAKAKKKTAVSDEELEELDLDDL